MLQAAFFTRYGFDIFQFITNVYAQSLTHNAYTLKSMIIIRTHRERQTSENPK